MATAIGGKRVRQRPYCSVRFCLGGGTAALQADGVAVPGLSAVRQIDNPVGARAHATSVGQCLPARTAGMDPWQFAGKRADLNGVIVRFLSDVHRKTPWRDVVVTIEIRRSAHRTGVWAR